MNAGMGGAGASQPQVGAAEMVVAEMKGTADLFSRMLTACYGKCIANVKEATLQVGEMSCVDRCVSKYMDVHSKVGVELQNTSQQMQPDGASE
mmetsp:Transcript_67481/g.161937  ORF Transcript_67481/g.161937 Transcript_67481/m.161937 type:complete len:93 (-) Transcript_67481:86-364(-)